MGPNLSMLHESAMAPVRGTKPNEGRSPVNPQRVDGDEIEPSVSDPLMNAKHPSAAAAPAPTDDPLDPCFLFPGFLVPPPTHPPPIPLPPTTPPPTPPHP